MSYKHITRDKRVELSTLLRAGIKKKEISEQLGIDRTTIWREIKRNKGKRGEYDVRTAHAKACRRRQEANDKGNKIKNNEDLKRYITKKLRLYWSPEQISGRLKIESEDRGVCHETIYRYIYEQDPELKKYLRQKKGRYRRRHGTKKRRIQASEMMKKRIDQRPSIVEERKRVGDWEGDLVIGKERKKAILTHVDRKSGLLRATKLEQIDSEYVKDKIVSCFQKVSKRHCCTVTYDNGSSFAKHDLVEREANVEVYFAYPYRSWERATNENTNGLLRQFYPKKSPFKEITQKNLDKIVSLINNRPRKRLHYRTPLEVFHQRCTSS